MTNKVLNIIREKSGTIHWWSNKVTSVLLIPVILYLLVDTALFMSTQSEPSVMLFIHALFHHNSLLLLVTNIVLLLHIRSGVETIIEDYVHEEEIQIISVALTRILTVQIIKYLYLCAILF